MLNGPFHSAVIRSYAARQPAIFTCAVLEQAPVIKRSGVVQMEANNNRPGHSVQQQRRRFTATQLQFCIRGTVKKKKVKRPVTEKRPDFCRLSSLHGSSCEANAQQRRRSAVYGLLIVSEGVAV